jgi:hypothetical protein
MLTRFLFNLKYVNYVIPYVLYQCKNVFNIFLQVSSQFSSIPSKTAIEKRLLVKVIKATSLGAKKGNHLYNFILYTNKCKKYYLLRLCTSNNNVYSITVMLFYV